jgi:hypothetical protein
MEKQANIDDKGNDILLKTVVLAVILICMGIIKAVSGGGDSANFAGRTRWLAIQVLRILPRVYTQTAESIFETKKGYDKVAKMFQDIWNVVFDRTPHRRKGDTNGN